MFVPVTKKDFIRIGTRLNSTELINESDRLLKLAGEDIGQLTRRGYTSEKLDELRQLRERLVLVYAARRDIEGQKRGAREEEARTMEEGRTALASGAAGFTGTGPEGSLFSPQRRHRLHLADLGGRARRRLGQHD